MEINEEELILSLNRLYSLYGYRHIRSECFEDFSLFLENRDFLLCKNVIAFPGKDGKLLSLRPDVTLSLIKHLKSSDKKQKLFYNENVFRQSKESGDFQEIRQTGVEVIGEIDDLSHAEITYLILKTLSYISDDFVLCVSHMAYLEGLAEWYELNYEQKNRLYSLLKDRNGHDFSKFADECNLNADMRKVFNALISPEISFKDLEGGVENEQMQRGYTELKNLFDTMNELGYEDKIRLDFSLINDDNYYDGLLFCGYIKGIPQAVLSGGRYDKLVKKLEKKGGAIGFAIYLGQFLEYDNSLANPAAVVEGQSVTEALKKGISLAEKGEKVFIGISKD